MSLSAQILIGMVLGIAVGLFFGELVAPVGYVGQAFILLLQMTVLPYIALALIKGLGSLKARQAIQLARTAGGFLLLLWAISLAAVLMVPLAFPHWTSASFFSTNLVQERPPFDFLGLFIPANPFASLSQNVVPAVVVFCVALGIALIRIEGTEPLMRAFSILTDALGDIAGWVVRLAPIGVFAITAQAAGTMDPSAIRGLQVYVAAYVGVTLVLSLWVLPGLVTILTPFRQREIFGMTRDALITGFATGNLFVVLSVLTEKSKELVQLHVEQADEADSLVEVVVPTAFTLPSAGKLMALSFVLFAGWLSGFGVSPSEYPAFVVSGLFTFFGNTYVAIPFLLDMFRVPSDTFHMFVVVDSIIGTRFGVLLAAMHILVVSLLAASAVTGLLRVDWVRALRYAGVTVVAMVAVLLGVRAAFEAIGNPYEGYQRFIQRDLLEEGVPSTLIEAAPEPLPSVDHSLSTLERIRKRGALRVGYFPDRLPAAFQNEEGRLVGFDVELMHRLARDLGVKVEFVKTLPDQSSHLLSSGYLDLGMGRAITPDVMEQLDFSNPYMDETLAFLVPDHLRHRFSSGEALKALESVRLGIPHSPYYIEKVKRYLPQAEIIEYDSPRPFLRQQTQDIDAFVFTAEAGSAWCLVYPEFTVAVPQPDLLRVPFAIPVALGDQKMVGFLNRWLDLKRRDHTLDRLFDYWYRGKAPEKRVVRWSVIRNVLGWVD